MPCPRGRRPSRPVRAGELRRRRPAPVAARPRRAARGFAELRPRPLRHSESRSKEERHERAVLPRSPARSRATRGRTITEADVVSFAALTGDWHPQHADAEWASQGRFGERVAHGMLVLSYALGLMPLRPRAGGRAARPGFGRASSARCGSATRSASRSTRRARSARSTTSTPWSTLAWRVRNQDDRHGRRAPGWRRLRRIADAAAASGADGSGRGAGADLRERVLL